MTTNRSKSNPDWKQQLAELYKKMSKDQKDKKGTTTTKDQLFNYKNKKGFSDAGIPITEKAVRDKQRNRSNYLGHQKSRYHFSRLRQINDARYELGRKYRYKNPEHVRIVERAVQIAKEEIEGKMPHISMEQHRKLVKPKMSNYIYWDKDNTSQSNKIRGWYNHETGEYETPPKKKIPKYYG